MKAIQANLIRNSLRNKLSTYVNSKARIDETQKIKYIKKTLAESLLFQLDHEFASITTNQQADHFVAAVYLANKTHISALDQHNQGRKFSSTQGALGQILAGALKDIDTRDLELKKCLIEMDNGRYEIKRKLLHSLGIPELDAEQDVLNPSVLTTKEHRTETKSYYLYNDISKKFSKFLEYQQRSDKQTQNILLGAGAMNEVFSRTSTKEVIVRRPKRRVEPVTTQKIIYITNLLGSLLYSIPNHAEISNSINIGFIKSSQKDPGWKMLSPIVLGATLTQMFGTRFCFQSSGEYSYRYGQVSNPELMSLAKEQYLHQLATVHESPAIKLWRDYITICKLAERHGYYIYHSDLEPYNVMYDIRNGCLSLIDCDSWVILKERDAHRIERIRAEEREKFKIIAYHHSRSGYSGANGFTVPVVI